MFLLLANTYFCLNAYVRRSGLYLYIFKRISCLLGKRVFDFLLNTQKFMNQVSHQLLRKPECNTFQEMCTICVVLFISSVLFLLIAFVNMIMAHIKFSITVGTI